ncbi:MAG: hypothetical protein KDE25_00145 [Novosphingobium sp.]|nr:hypothetical protein [Novosphingobium sp.]
MRWMIMAAGFAISASSVVAEPLLPFQQGREGSILGTPAQIEADRRALAVYNSREVQKAIDALVATYEKDPVAQYPDARKTLRRAAEAMAMAQSFGVVAADPDRSQALWGTTGPHAWGDVVIPVEGVMVDNPDNIYRSIPIDGAASYVIEGRVIHAAPVQQTFVLHNEKSGADPNQKVKSQEDENGSVALEDLDVARDGTFTITVDNSPVNGRTNHLQSDPDVHDAYILVRDTIPDWSGQNPVQLNVKRVAGPPVKPLRSQAEMAAKAAALTGSVSRYFMTWAKQRFYSGAANTFAHQFDRATGWGFIKCGWYRLEADEALVVTLDRRNAAYLGFQLSDAWGQGQTSDYMANLGSLSGDQARANADGTYTYVISTSDPGIHNWLDTAGLRVGTYCARWQALPQGVKSAGAVKSMTVVKRAELDAALPPETVRVTAEQRAMQIAQRRKDYARRLQY